MGNCYSRSRICAAFFSMTPSPSDSRPAGAHWLVRMNRRNRTFFYGLLFLAFAAHLRAIEASTGAWVLLALQFLVYPQCVYWRARRAENQRQAEMQNLLVDAILGGLWAAGLGLPIWVTFTLFSSNCINLVVFYGYGGLLRLLCAMGSGVAAGLALGMPLHPETDLLTTLLCIVVLTFYFVAFAHDGYARAMEQHRNHGRLREQFDEIRTLQGQLKEQAVRDPLTGLFNRRHLDAVLGSCLQRCRESGQPLSLLMIDIDHFKHINDAHGHAAGDAVLQTLAQLLLRHVRPQDVACRHGGEEFLLVLPEAPATVALERAEAVRAAFEALQVRCGDRLVSATLSCGVAMFPEDADTETSLLESADRALYAAKVQGRNRAVAFSSA